MSLYNFFSFMGGGQDICMDSVLICFAKGNIQHILFVIKIFVLESDFNDKSLSFVSEKSGSTYQAAQRTGECYSGKAIRFFFFC